MQEKLLIADSEIPVNIFIERRNSVRASIVSSGINIRIPFSLSISEREKTIERLKNWAIKKLEKNEALQKKFSAKTYQSGQVLKVQDQEFELLLLHKDRKSYSGKLLGNKIVIFMPLEATQAEIQTILPRLISNLMSKCFQQRIANRVHAFNEKYFGKKVKKVGLKYTKSIWGSCSSNGNITLSSRLLLATQEAMDYVIIHELAHTIHPNHSAAFWAEVARVMPRYKEEEAWLKKYGPFCDF